MAVFSPAQLAVGLKARQSGAYIYLINTHSAQFYTFCLKICLMHPNLAQDLLAKVLADAMDDVDGLADSVEIWFYRHLHNQWAEFSKRHEKLRSHPTRLSLDWSRPMGRQSEDALELLSVSEREIFLHRFFLSLSLPEISKITGLGEKRIVDVFNDAVNKLSSV